MIMVKTSKKYFYEYFQTPCRFLCTLFDKKRVISTDNNFTQKFLLFSILFTLVYSGHADALQPTFIRGTIFDAFDNTVINSATISTTSGLSTVSSSGSFYLRVPPNVYTLIVSSPGYILFPQKTLNPEWFYYKSRPIRSLVILLRPKAVQQATTLFFCDPVQSAGG